MIESEEYYVFVVTDPTRNTSIGQVFELDQETNNDRHSDVPMIIELPPPTDLQVTDIVVPATARSGEPITISWTVSNASQTEPAIGTWSDTAYLSTDATWDLHDVPIGRLSHSGTLNPGESYTLSLDTLMPPATPGQYRVIVRTDIFNQIYEREFDVNNKTASPETMSVTVDELLLDVPLRDDLIDRSEAVVPGDAYLTTRHCESCWPPKPTARRTSCSSVMAPHRRWQTTTRRTKVDWRRNCRP